MTSPLSVLPHCRLKTAALILTAVLVCPAGAGAADIKNPFHEGLFVGSASTMMNHGAFFRNPVFADYSDSSFLNYRPFSFGGTGDWNHHLSLGFSGFAFSYTRFNSLYDPELDEVTDSKTTMVNITKGFMFGNYFGIGFDYGFSAGRRPYDDYRSFSMGFLLRPFSFLSVGLAFHDLNSPRMEGNRVLRKETYSISLRPLNERFTLSLDAVRYQDRKIDVDDLQIAACLLAPFDISVYAGADMNSNVFFGLSLPLEFQSQRGSAMVMEYSGIRMHKGPGFSAPGLSLVGEKYREPAVMTKAYLKIVIGGGIHENPEEKFLQKSPVNLHEILAGVDEAARDRSITGIILVVGDVSLGIAQIQELREEFKKFRRHGKKICALLTSSGNRGYYLSSAADRIYYAPANTFILTGLVAEVYFFKTLLDRVGVKFESVSKGKYKSFNEPFTRTGMSDEYRENLKTLLAELNEQYLSQIAADRGIKRAVIEELFSKGFSTPEDAVKAGFIDGVEYHDAMERKILEEGDGVYSAVELEEYLDRPRRIYRWGTVPGIAVIHVEGAIIKGGEERPGIIMPDAISDQVYRESLRSAFTDPSIKAIVVRINSGGGSAVASDFMWHYLVELNRRYKKQVVISFGNMAASGGYYIACTGDHIFASPGTVTGSIGVIMGKLSFKTLYEKLGISKEIISLSEFADLFTESRDLSPKEREVLQRGVEFTYQLFTRRVMEARKIDAKDIAAAAEGRVFTGNQARDKKLVDSMGGLMAALEFARLKLKTGSEYNVIHYPVKKAPLMKFLGSAGTSELNGVLRQVQKHLAPLALADENVLCLYPLRIEIK